MFLDPKDIIDQLNLRYDLVAAEFGSGSGGFSIPLAKRLDEGLVYAIDILAEPLSALKGRMILERIKNIRIIRSDLEKPKGSTLQGDSLDLVVIPNMLFQAENKSAIILEAKRALKKKGVLVIIDWGEGGPEEKLPKEEAKKLAQEAGFSFLEELEAGKYHYGFIFLK